MKLPTVVVFGMLLGLIGCRSVDDAPGSGSGGTLAHDADTADDPVDGRWCGNAGHGMKVFINIRYAPNGTPSASPQSCEVDQGTTVTWRGPEGSPVVFRLDFPGGPPTTAEHLDFESDSRHGSRQKFKIVASSQPGTYKYGITANGEHIDPDVIIRPN